MRSIVCAAVSAMLIWIMASPAQADDDLRWKRTTPRANLSQVGEALELRVPVGRAWGITSRAIAVEGGRAYRGSVELDVPAEGVRGGFLRVALYERSDGRGRQRLRLDAPSLAGAAGEEMVAFAAPAWAHSAKLRILVRASGQMTVPLRAWHARLVASGAVPPEVVLMPDD